MKKIPALTLVAALFVSVVTPPVMAQFGGLPNLLGGGKSGGSGNIDNDVKSFMEKSVVINRLSAVALVAISTAYDKDADAAGAQAKIDKLNNTTDPKEQNALVAEVNKSEGAKVAQLSQASDLGKQTENLSKEKQKLVGTAVGNFLIAGLRAVDLTRSGQSLVGSVSGNPSAIVKLLPVKDTLPLLGDAVGNAAKVMPKFIDVLRGAKVDVPKITADSKETAIHSI
jgi:hypothetical protein